MKTSEFPSGTTNLSKGVVRDPDGIVWRKKEESDEWQPESSADVALLYEKTLAKTVLSIFSGGLENSGDVVQIRRVGDRLTWIKANRRDEKWQELTPEIARQIEAAAVLEGQAVIDAEKAEKLKAIKIGWYQDFQGNLYQFDGAEWSGGGSESILRHKPSVEDLEYLG